MNTLVKQLSVLVLMVLSGAAFAEGAPAPSAGGIEQFILLGGFVLIFYFLMWRPQSKRAKEHRELVSGLNKGDEIVTTVTMPQVPGADAVLETAQKFYDFVSGNTTKTK